MTLYQEFPKQSIMTALRQHFTEVELDAVRLEIFDLMTSCRTLDELRGRVYEILRGQNASELFKRTHEGNLMGI